MELLWREDASNGDVSIARNALRHTVVPKLIQALDRDPVVGAARSRYLLAEDAAALDQLARQLMAAAYAGNQRLNRAELRHLPNALLRRALSAWVESAPVDSISGGIGNGSTLAGDLRRSSAVSHERWRCLYCVGFPAVVVGANRCESSAILF